MRASLRLVLLIVATVQQAVAQNDLDAIGYVALSHGDAIIVKADGQQHVTQRGSPVFDGDHLETSANGLVHIRVQDSGLIAMRCGSRIEIQEHRSTNREDLQITLVRGQIRIVTDTSTTNNLLLQTRFTSVRIDEMGTDFGAAGDGENDEAFAVYQGNISVTNSVGTIRLGTGADFGFAVVSDDAGPVGITNIPTIFLQDQGCEP